MQLENKTQLQLLRHRATEVAAARAKVCLELNTIRTDLDKSTAKIKDLVANLAHATERELKVVREARQLRTDTQSVGATDYLAEQAPCV